MLLLSHTGITLAVAAIISNILPVSKQTDIPAHPGDINSHAAVSGATHLTFFDRLAHYVDMRLIFVGSMLPDIIDKPLGHLIFKDQLSNGRLMCHSLLFFILLSLSGIFLWRKSNKRWLMAVSFGVILHLVLDQMWLNPGTLFWPALGFPFEKIDIENWMPIMLHNMVTDPALYVPELTGLFFLLWFVWVIFRKKSAWFFIKSGAIRKDR